MNDVLQYCLLHGIEEWIRIGNRKIVTTEKKQQSNTPPNLWGLWSHHLLQQFDSSRKQSEQQDLFESPFHGQNESQCQYTFVRAWNTGLLARKMAHIITP